MQIARYTAVIVCSILAGWFSQSWLADMRSSADVQQTIEASVASEASAGVVVTPDTNNKTTESSAVEASSSQPIEITPITFIENLSSMDREAFDRYLNTVVTDNIDISKELLIGILDVLPTITDSKTWYRVVDFLSFSRDINGQDRNYVAEDWVMGKVRDAEQQGQWLEVASHLGVWRKGNAEFLANNLESFHDSESRVSALLALSRYIDLDRMRSVGLDSGSAANLAAAKIERFFNSEHELERAAAVSTLRSFPSNNYNERIVNALDDPSESVRLSAIFTLSGGGRRPNEMAIKDGLIKRMQSTDASDFERVNAWVALGLFQLEGEHYQAVYEFGVNDQERLTQRYKSEALRPRSQWGY